MIEYFKYVPYYKVQSRTRYMLDLSIWYRNSSDKTVPTGNFPGNQTKVLKSMKCFFFHFQSPPFLII